MATRIRLLTSTHQFGRRYYCFCVVQRKKMSLWGFVLHFHEHHKLDQLCPDRIIQLIILCLNGFCMLPDKMMYVYFVTTFCCLSLMHVRNRCWSDAKHKACRKERAKDIVRRNCTMLDGTTCDDCMPWLFMQNTSNNGNGTGVDTLQTTDQFDGKRFSLTDSNARWRMLSHIDGASISASLFSMYIFNS